MNTTSRRARYRITHETRYRYAANVTLSQQLLHLQPRDMPYQTCTLKNSCCANKIRNIDHRNHG